MERKINITWPMPLLSRITSLMFVFLLIIIILFLLGNIQNFLDSTQLMLMHIFDVSSVIYLVFGIYYLGYLILSGIRNKKLKIIYFLSTFIGITLILIMYVVIKFIFVWV